MVKHKHHILPKHMGGTDDKINIIELSIEEHALAHKELYEKYGKKEDYLAWKGLFGLIDKQELIYELLKMAGLKGNAIHVNRYHNDPEYAAEIRRKQSKPKSTTCNMKKPKSEEHRKNISESHKNKERTPCLNCKKEITHANYKKHYIACSKSN